MPNRQRTKDSRTMIAASATAALALALLAGCASAPAAPAPAAPEVAAPAAAAPSPAKPAEGFTLLQINDTYKIEGLRAGTQGGLGRVRELRRELETEGRAVVVLHAGDFLFPSVMSKYLQGAPMVSALNLLDGSEAFDDRMFVTFGNHEFDSSNRQVLFDRIAESRFRWVSSNVRLSRADGEPAAPAGELFPNVVDHVVVDVGGIRLGIFGLTLADQPRPWVEYGFAPETRRATAERALDALEREGAEFVVALTHQNIGEDEWLARELGSRIDWIAGGHEHLFLRRKVGEVEITKADADALSALRIDVRRSGGAIAATAEKVDLDASRKVDPAMAREVAVSLIRLEEAVREKSGRSLLDVVATSEHLLEGTEPAIRGRETALGNFLCDVLRERFAADVALVNGGAIRVNDDVPPGGDVRVYELEGIFYYDEKPVVAEISGRDLLALLEKSVSEADLGHGRFFQVSGIRFRYRVPESGPPSVDAADVAIAAPSGGFAPIELDRLYRVATLDYIWRNGYRDGYPLFSLGAGGASPKLVESATVSWRTLTEEAIGKLPERRITTAVDGRIERVEEAAR
jgi:5'-nucleotidase